MSEQRETIWDFDYWARMWSQIQPGCFTILTLFFIGVAYFAFRSFEGFQNLGYNLITEFAGISLTIIAIERITKLSNHNERKEAEIIRLRRLAPLRRIVARQLTIVLYDTFVATHIMKTLIEHGYSNHAVYFHYFVNLRKLQDEMQQIVMSNNTLLHEEEFFEFVALIERIQKHKTGLGYQTNGIFTYIPGTSLETQDVIEIDLSHVDGIELPDIEATEIENRFKTLVEIDVFLNKINPERSSIRDDYNADENSSFGMFEYLLANEIAEPSPEELLPIIVEDLSRIWHPTFQQVFIPIVQHIFAERKKP